MEREEGFFMKLVDNISFFKIILFWIIMIIVFGIIDFIFAVSGFPLTYGATQIGSSFNGFIFSIFFSFISSVTLGYSKNLIAQGLVSYFIIAEAIITLFFLGVLIIKLFASNQSIFKTTIHHVPFQKKIHTAGIMLSIFRSDVEEIIHKLNKKKSKFSKKDFEAASDTLYIGLIEIEHLFSKNSEYYNKLKPFHFSMIIDNIDNSLEKLFELLVLFNNEKVDWKEKNVVFNLKYDCDAIEKISANIEELDSGKSKTLNDKIARIRRLVGKVREHLD